MRALWLVPLSFAGACKSTYLVEGFDGDWSGTASESTGLTYPMVASFSWDDDKENLDGDVTIDTTYVYVANGITSDKDAAEILLDTTVGFGPGTLSGVKLNEDGDKMSGKFTINVCPGGLGELCELTGDFDMEM